MRLNRFVLAFVTLLVVTGVVAGIVTGAFVSLGRAGLYATGLLTDGGASTVPPRLFETPAPRVTPATAEPIPPDQPVRSDQPDPVLAPLQPVPAPRAGRVQALVNGIDRKAMQGSFSGSVIDAGSGATLYAHQANKPYIPASTTKVVTTAAALSILGPEHRFTTAVVRSGAGRVILVGGGDPYLVRKSSAGAYPARASLASLAKATAKKLKQTKHTKVALGYDASLFTGPAWNSDWPSFYGDQVTRISALWVGEGRVNGGSPGPRVADPARSAADAFAAALRTQGIGVSKVTAVRAKKGALQLAVVRSMPLARIVQQLLMVSDNDAAEVVFRQAAIGAGKVGSSAEARKVVQGRLTKLGVWSNGTQIRDGSGLSRHNLVSAQTMAKTLRLAVHEKHPELRAVATGLPVAGVEGSLRSRYFDKQTEAARGLVRGKTGTLNGVRSLAGYVPSKDGSILAYAFLVNKAKNEYAARVWLEDVSAALAKCGCR